jgi:hypothetical protein
MAAVMLQNFVRILAWFALAYIAVITLSTIGLRPVMTANPLYERFVAFAVVAALFELGYSGRTVFVTAVIIGSTMGLEALQHLTPDRHGHLVDFFEKASGGLFGIFAVNAIRRYPPFANLLESR